MRRGSVFYRPTGTEVFEFCVNTRQGRRGKRQDGVVECPLPGQRYCLLNQSASGVGLVVTGSSSEFYEKCMVARALTAVNLVG